MTAAQLNHFISNQIATKIKFDWSKTEFKFIYLGQTCSNHFFVLRISPVSEQVNSLLTSEAIKLLDKYGFSDTHWCHNTFGPTTYCYYCYIDDETMNKLK